MANENRERVLMFSHRHVVSSMFARCLIYEFEDIIQQIDSVQVVAPRPGRWFKYGTRLAQRLAADFPISINPGIKPISVGKEYDLFFTCCEFAKDLLALNALRGWKERCKTSVCWIDETLVSEFINEKCFAKMMSGFDHVVVGCKQGVGLTDGKVPGQCLFLPPGVDAIRFCPYPNPPERFIDVLSIGRRAETTHGKLLDMAKEGRIFYFYDSTNGNEAVSWEQHRLLVANLCKRSRYFIVNPGKFDQPEATGDEDIIGARYFEGAASGSVMIGEMPRNEEFRRFVHWQDAVIRLPYDSADIDRVMTELEAEPSRVETIRRNNVVESLLNHDWAYRWEAVLGLAGLDPLPALTERKKSLEGLSRIATLN
jgi:hypothetical protein